MLAYDLYLKNKDYQYEFTNANPIKKIFVSVDQDGNLSTKVDDTTLQQYGINENDSKKFQSCFQMPDRNRSQLPYRGTGSNSPKPYLEFEGVFESRKNKSRFLLNYTGKRKDSKDKSKFVAELEIQENNEAGFSQNSEEKFKINIPASEGPPLQVRLDKSNYCTEDCRSIYELYEEYGVITDGFLNFRVFQQICLDFFRFLESRWINELSNTREKTISTRFSLVVLPTTKKILYLENKSDNTVESNTRSVPFIDSFGNETSDFPQDSTQTAKFMSFDDPAFSLNCKTKSEFYKNLSIGRDSFKAINIPNDSVINISGLSWIFTDLDDPSYKFEEVKKGIFHQLLINYNHFKRKAGDSYRKQSVLKIICFEKNQAKLEILLDANLTMQTMRKIFRTFNDVDVFQNDIPPFSFEVLIDDTSGTKPIWSFYINAIQSLLHEKTMDRLLLLTLFVKRIRSKIFEWVTSIQRNKSEITEFFAKSELCMKILTRSNIDIESVMNSDEEYAYKVGLIAGKYISFKQQANENSNTLKDILTYSKYDRERLRFVFQRVCMGINLSNSNEANRKSMIDFVKQHNPSQEISDSSVNTDYSYFFYKGAFQELC